MSFLRIIFGLLLVFLPITRIECFPIRNATLISLSKELKVVRKEVAKDSLLNEAEVFESQEENSQTAKGKYVSQDFCWAGRTRVDLCPFELQKGANRGLRVATNLSLFDTYPPLYILYHCLTIPC